MKHTIRRTAAPAGRPDAPATSGSTPDTDEASACRRAIADYPLRRATSFGLTRRAAAGMAIARTRSADVLADVREGAVSAQAAERAYGVVLRPAGRSWANRRERDRARCGADAGPGINEVYSGF